MASAKKVNQGNEYSAEYYERLSIFVDKGRRANIKAHAKARGESINGFVNRAIREAMLRDDSEGKKR